MLLQKAHFFQHKTSGHSIYMVVSVQMGQCYGILSMEYHAMEPRPGYRCFASRAAGKWVKRRRMLPLQQQLIMPLLTSRPESSETFFLFCMILFNKKIGKSHLEQWEYFCVSYENMVVILPYQLQEGSSREATGTYCHALKHSFKFISISTSYADV